MSGRVVISRRALAAHILSPDSQHRDRLVAMSLAMRSHRTPHPKNRTSQDSSATPWPRSLQIAGYTVIFLSIPYTGSVILAESPSWREWVESHLGTFGHSVVGWVRWYWGEEEKRPYGEVFWEDSLKLWNSRRLGNTEDVVSLIIPREDRNISIVGKDLSSKVRLEQERIQQRIDSRVKVRIIGTSDEIGPLLKERQKHDRGTIRRKGFQGVEWEWNELQSPGIDVDLPGRIHIHDANEFKNELTNEQRSQLRDTFDRWNNQHLILTFPDDAQDNLFDEKTSDVSTTEDEQSDHHTLLHLLNIWSVWQDVPSPDSIGNRNGSNAQSGRSRKNSLHYDNLRLQIDEAEWNISELQRLLNDPSCPRDRDDMERELHEYKTKLSQLKRNRWWNDMKRLVMFS